MRRRAFLPIAIWLALVAGPIDAAEPSPTAAPPGTGVPNLLDRPVIDAVVLDDGESGNAATMLVVLPPGLDDTAPVELLSDEPDGWQTLGRVSVELPPAEGRVTPFLVGDGVDATLTLVSPAPSGTRLAALGTGDSDLRVMETASAAGWLIGAGQTDVDGDGATELVVASQNRRATDGPLCATRLEIRDPGSLALRSTSFVMATLGAASLAQLDDRLGTDLAAIVEAPCGEAPDRAERGDLLAVRLADGGRIALPPASLIPAPIVEQDPTTFLDPSIPPVPLYLDPGGRGSLTGLDGGYYPLAVAPAGDGAAWVVSLDTSPGAGVNVRPTDLVLQRVSAGAAAVRVVDLGMRPDLLAWSEGHVDDGYRAHGPAGFIADVDADGCPELIVPLLTIPCATDPDATPRPGPSWIGTRPFGVVEGRQRRLLVAASLEWYVPGDGLLPPNPVATATAVGGWRTVGSPPFAIGELRAQDLLYFPRFPRPTPTVDPGTGRDDPEAVVAGRAGERILARVEPIDPATVAAETDPPELAEFLQSAAAGPAGREPVLLRTPVRPGGLSGVDDIAHHLPLGPAGSASEGSAWRLTAVTVNDWGEIAGPIQAGVLIDLVGPSLVLEAPAVSLPWPLTATLHGTTESGASVEVTGGETIEADRRGRYAVELSLAPWPQDVTVRATDREGNETVRTVSVMGGFDVRQIPWQVIVAAAVLAAVVLAALRDARRQAPALGDQGRWAAPDGGQLGRGLAWDGVDEPPSATIEELDPLPRG